jgi:hypothetical protein
MKKAKFSKGLQLNKETIAKLNKDELNHLKGGTIGDTTKKPSGTTCIPNVCTSFGARPCGC